MNADCNHIELTHVHGNMFWCNGCYDYVFPDDKAKCSHSGALRQIATDAFECFECGDIVPIQEPVSSPVVDTTSTSKKVCRHKGFDLRVRCENKSTVVNFYECRTCGFVGTLLDIVKLLREGR